MSGSSFGKAFQITTWGESHGPAIGVTIQGCPPNLKLNETIIQKALDRRKPFSGSASTSRKEPDQVQILSGTFDGNTTGTPISLMILNKDAKSRSYSDIAKLFRPGHGDFSYHHKYGIRDYRGGGRASARETAARVAAGAVAQVVLDQYGIDIHAYTLELGGIRAETINLKTIDSNRLQCPDPHAADQMEHRIRQVKQAGDSVGGVVEIQAVGVPPGLGDPVFDKLDADLAKGLMSIGAVKGVEIGEGFGVSVLKGSENNDALYPDGFKTNHAGGILAGISTGAPIAARAYVKPIPSISVEQDTIDQNGKSAKISTHGRHDICALPRINQVCKSMIQITLADHLLRQVMVAHKPIR